MGITNIGKFLQELNSNTVYGLVEKAAKKSINKVTGRTRVILKGEELKALGLENELGCIPHPRLIIGGNNTTKGQSVWGATVCDSSGQPVQSFAISYDVTRGKNPIYQLRRQVFDGKKKIFAGTEYANTNKQIDLNSAEVKTSISHNNGMTTGTADLGDVYHFNAATQSDKKCADFWTKNRIGIPGAKSVQSEVNALARPEEIDSRIKIFLDQFRPKNAAYQKKLKSISLMDLNAVEKEISIQQAKMQKVEQEFDEMYAKIFGTGEKVPNWHENFYTNQIPTINPITGEKLPKKTIDRIHKTMQRYNETRELLLNLGQKKMVLLGGNIAEKNYIAKMIEQMGIKIGKTTDEAMIKELQALRGLPKIEILEKSKDIICKKVGLPPELVKIHPAPNNYGLSEYCAAFDETQACLYYHPAVLAFSDDMLIAAMRHELDHFERLAKTAKVIGLDKYKQLVCKTDEELKAFDEENWEKILEHINVEKGFNPEPYIKSKQEYVTPFRSAKNTIKYFSNPLENYAYQAGLDIEIALNGNNIGTQTAQQLILSKLCTKIQINLDDIQKLKGKYFDLDHYIDKAVNQAKKMIPNPEHSSILIEICEKMLAITERDLAKVKTGQLENVTAINYTKQAAKIPKKIQESLKKSATTLNEKSKPQ